MARDEAALIADAIASARPIVDEVIVVDTGSTDATVEIARQAGARVVQAPWPGDLGAAHNLPVAHARGDWVLVLDADEVVDPQRRHLVRDLIRSGSCDGYAMPVRNYTYGWTDSRWRPTDPRDPLVRGAAGYVPTAPIRLFRRDPAHRFSGALHQTVVPAIRANGGSIGDADVPLHHYGFLRFDRAKSERYRRLATRQVMAHPDRAQSWIDLGIILAEQDFIPAAADAFRRARRLGNHGDAPFLLGSAVLDMGHPEAAVPPLHEALGTAGDDTHHCDPADVWDALGQAFEELDRTDDAEAAYRQAATAGKPVSMANLAGLLIDSGRIAEAATLLDELLDRYPGIDLLWSLRGAVCLRTGDPAAASDALERALDIRPENLAAQVNLALAYRRDGRPGAARRALAVAREGVDSAEGTHLGLARRIGRRRRTTPAVAVPEGPGLVLSIIPALVGGGGRVLVDAVRALRGRPQVVATTNAYDFSGQGLREELEALGVPVLTVPAEVDLHHLLGRLGASVVLHHWWNRSIFRGPLRVGGARWICIGHAPLPMPLGYDAWVANSSYHRGLQGHLPPDRIVDLPNGVDLQRLSPAADTAGDRVAPVTVVMVSRLDPGKFPRGLLDHLPSLDGARLVIAGFGARRHELEPEIADRGLADRIRFLGPVPAAGVPRLLAGADIGLHLTEMHRELCSMSMLEMLASGLPVVAEPKGGLPEMVHHGVNGFLGDRPDVVADHLRRLIDDPALRRRMGGAGRQIAQRYDMAAWADTMRRLVTDVEQSDPLPQGLGQPAATRAAQAAARSAGGDPARPDDQPVAAAEDHAPGLATPPADPAGLTYLICSTHRSGSNLLCQVLANTGLAGRPEEFFSPTYETTLTARYGVGTVEAYLAELRARTCTPNGVFGIKVMFDDLIHLIDQLRTLTGPADLQPADVLTTALPGVRYVWIRREDRVRQAISYLRAQQTGVWLPIQDQAPPVTSAPRYDAVGIQRRIDEIDDRERRWEAFFVRAEVAPIRVRYEDLVADPDMAVRRVLRALGVAVPDDLVLGRPLLVKQADALTEEWVQRFRSSAASPH
ncbi:MAG TPA: Stf0 family sulfotransferase [Euzebya sp.]|nr:Stf0 family sulfotransferase [Euzebya sp.]